MDKFVNALNHHDFVKINDYLSEDINVNIVIDDKNRTMLHMAVIFGDYEVFQLLLSYGADVNMQDLKGDSPLILAINAPRFFHRLNIVRELISCGADVNHKNHLGQTALHRACLLGCCDVVAILLQAGAAVHIKDHKGKMAIEHTPRVSLLFIAVQASECVVGTPSTSPYRPSGGQVQQLHQSSENVGTYNKPRIRAVSVQVCESNQSLRCNTFLRICEPACLTCRRKVRDCGAIKKANFRYCTTLYLLYCTVCVM